MESSYSSSVRLILCSMDANRDEADRAKERGIAYLRAKNYGQARKFLEISNRLCFHVDTQRLLEELSGEQRQNDIDQPQTQERRTSASSHRQFTLTLESIRQKFNELEEKYVYPPCRPYTKPLLLIVIYLFISRVVFGKKLSLGSLPGDIYYNSNNMMVSAPIITSAVVSIFLSAFFSLFKQ